MGLGLSAIAEADTPWCMKRLLLALITSTFLVGHCFSQDALHQGNGITAGKWINIYVGNPNLAGVLVTQYPADQKEKHLFDGKHPFVLSFVMWDGSINETYYDPEGRVVSAGWWRLKDMKSYDPQILWRNVDFSLGSDPKFKHHKDPRKNSSV